jgi:hypothetical protein
VNLREMAYELNWLATAIACGERYDKRRVVRMLRATAVELKAMSEVRDGRDDNRSDEQAGRV